jgi:peptidoglycan hydrolase CwlO-like protein
MNKTITFLLIAFFLYIITCHIIYTFFLIEGLENSSSSGSNCGYLIKVMGKLEKINNQMQDLSGNVQSLQGQVNGLAQSQQQYADQLTGGTAPQITGT